MTQWENETCFNCRYRVNAACRRFPPIGNGYFPQVLMIMNNGKEEFNIACAEHKPTFKPDSSKVRSQSW